MTWIKTGTVSINNSTNVLNGVGTSFVDVGILSSGDMVFLPNVAPLEVLSIQSNTQILLVGNYIGTNLSGSTYAIIPLGMLPSAVALSVKNVLTAQVALMGNTILSTAAQGLTSTQQGNARANIAALGAADVGAGRLVKSVAGGVDVTLTAAEAANQFFEYTGTITGNINVIFPSGARIGFHYNNTAGAYTLTVKTAAGTGTAVAQGGRTVLECDGTNVVNPLNSVSGPLAVVGALSSTGISVAQNAMMGQSLLGASYARFGHKDFNLTANYGFIQYSDGSNFIEGPNGLAVSGKLSSTGALTTAGIKEDATGNLTPGANGTQAFGSTSLRWSQVWCTAGAFNTSDARLKTPVTLLSTIEKQAAAQFSREIGTFQWLDSVKEKGAENARHHVGITVQRAQEILESFGLNAWRYGFMSYDKWDDEFVEHPAIEASDAVTEQRENSDTRLMEIIVITPSVQAKAAWTEQTKKAGDAYAFRYDQLNMFIAAGIEYRLTALEAISHG